MADDAAAPDGELSKSTATEETSTATEPARASPLSSGPASRAFLGCGGAAIGPDGRDRPSPFLRGRARVVRK